MKTIDKLFPFEVNFKELLNVAGIKIPDSFRFSDVNIVIGKNGAGDGNLYAKWRQRAGSPAY